MTSGKRDPVDRLQETKEIDVDSFNERVAEEAEVIRDHIEAGTFDNRTVTVGLEYEFYAVDEASRRLRRVPRAVLRSPGIEKELGLHNAELSTGVHPFNGPGIEALAREVEAKVTTLQRHAGEEGLRFVSDGTWTIGPAHNRTEAYLTQATHEEGLTLALNVSNAVRYHGFGSLDGHRTIGGDVDLPGASVSADNAGPVSLTSSIQPHYQCRNAREVPECHGIALRLAGPLLALGANSPFLPPELYDDPEPDRDVLLRESYVENRIPVYEQMMNPNDGPAKVRFPGDIDTATEAVDRIAEDEVIVPADISAGERFDDAFVHFRHKHGSYWRWVRPVFDGASEDTANARIEFRPLPGQPTIPDTTAFVAAFSGLMTALQGSDHPACDLSWETARENFYEAVRNGLDADLTWVTAAGERTGDTDRLYEDLFDAAGRGLEQRGANPSQVDAWLDPLRRRVARRLTPARWKRRAVAESLDAGSTPAEAIWTMQERYVDRQEATLYDGHLTDWDGPHSETIDAN